MVNITTNASLAYLDTFEHTLELWQILVERVGAVYTFTHDPILGAGHVSGMGLSNEEATAFEIRKTFGPSRNSLWQKIHFEFRITASGADNSTANLVAIIETPENVITTTVFDGANLSRSPEVTPADSGWQEFEIDLTGLRSSSPDTIQVKLTSVGGMNNATNVDFWIRNFYILRDPDTREHPHFPDGHPTKSTDSPSTHVDGSTVVSSLTKTVRTLTRVDQHIQSITIYPLLKSTNERSILHEDETVLEEDMPHNYHVVEILQVITP